MTEKDTKLQELGGKLKELRKEKNLSLSAVGKEVNISHNFLSEIESGKKEPSRETLRALANFYKVDEDIFFNILEKLPLRTIEAVKDDPNLQKLLSQVQKKYGNEPNKLDSVREKITRIYEEFLNEEE